MVKKSARQFCIKNCLFCAINIVQNTDKAKWVYYAYGIALFGVGSWSFGNSFARYVKVFGVDNSSSSHSDNCKNKVLVLGEGLTYNINGSFSSPEKNFSITFNKANTKFCFSLPYNGDNSNLFKNL